MFADIFSDIKKAELELQAAKFDVSIARAAFYPSLNISANMGLQAFKPISNFVINWLFKLVLFLKTF